MFGKRSFVTFRVNPYDLEKLKKEASIRGLTISAFVRAIISDYMVNEQAIKYVDMKLKPKVIKYWMTHNQNIQQQEQSINDVDNKEKKD